MKALSSLLKGTLLKFKLCKNSRALLPLEIVWKFSDLCNPRSSSQFHSFQFKVHFGIHSI